MKTFKYTARTEEGAIYKGKMEAKNRENVIESLHSKSMIVVKVDEEITGGFKRLKEINIGGVPMKDKVIFMRQLSTMISAGLPLSQALEILESQADNPLFKKVLGDVSDDIQNGMSLANAFKKNSDVFDEITVNLLDAGEESGHLEEILQRLAEELENQKELKDKMKSAFIYPIIIFIIVIGVVILLMVFLVPAMEEVYNDFDAELPLPTRVLIAMSNFTLSYWWALMLGAALLGIGFKLFADSKAGKRFLNKLVLKLPVFGVLMVKIQITQFTRVLSLLLKSGLSIIEALRLTAAAMSNQLFRDAVLDAKDEVEKGTSLAIPIARSEQFPLIVSQMISVGEESGEIDMILEKLAKYYRDEVNTMTGNLTTMLEPFILVIVGVLIGGIALAVYMPMFSLVSVIG